MTPAPHRPVDAPSGHRREGSARRALGRLGGLGVAALVLVAALSGIGGTFAMWSDQQSVDAGQLTAGTAELEAHWLGDSAAPGNLLPGQSATRKAELRNRGDVPLTLSISATAPTAGVTYRALAGSCAAAGQAPVVGPSASPLTSATSGGRAVVLQPGESLTACIAVTATPDLTPGAQMTFTINIEGTQIR